MQRFPTESSVHFVVSPTQFCDRIRQSMTRSTSHIHGLILKASPPAASRIAGAGRAADLLRQLRLTTL